MHVLMSSLYTSPINHLHVTVVFIQDSIQTNNFGKIGYVFEFPDPFLVIVCCQANT